MFGILRLARRTACGAILALGLSATGAAGSEPAAGSIPLAQAPYIFGIAVDRTDPSHLLLATRAGPFRAAAFDGETRQQKGISRR